MRSITILLTASLAAITFLASPPLAAGETEAKSKDPGLLPILRNLDFSKVGLIVDSQDEFVERLRKRAIARLKKVGLEPVSDLPGGTVDAMLVLVVNPMPLGKTCPGKVLYDRRIYLSDDVTIKRDPEIKMEAITWSLAPGHPSV